MSRDTAVVTGASAGIGAATARHLADAGFAVVLGARRTERLREVETAIGDHARALPLDVTDATSVEAFVSEVASCRVLVNNAGGAHGLEPVSEFDEAKWRWMYDANVLGVARVTKALLPKLLASEDGQVITIGSVAGWEPYVGGAGYNAAKHAVRAVTDVLRMELLGQPIRVSEVDPGMVETEFSLVRFDGDAQRAHAVYDGMTPLTADDVAACVTWMATLPSHVNVSRMTVVPRDQAGAGKVHRRSAEREG